MCEVVAVHISILVHCDQVVLAQEDVGQPLQQASVLLAFVGLLSFAEDGHERLVRSCVRTDVHFARVSDQNRIVCTGLDTLESLVFCRVHVFGNINFAWICDFRELIRLEAQLTLGVETPGIAFSVARKCERVTVTATHVDKKEGLLRFHSSWSAFKQRLLQVGSLVFMDVGVAQLSAGVFTPTKNAACVSDLKNSTRNFSKASLPPKYACCCMQLCRC